jgi:hypothetical protein
MAPPGDVESARLYFLGNPEFRRDQGTRLAGCGDESAQGFFQVGHQLRMVLSQIVHFPAVSRLGVKMPAASRVTGVTGFRDDKAPIRGAKRPSGCPMKDHARSGAGSNLGDLPTAKRKKGVAVEFGKGQG